MKVSSSIRVMALQAVAVEITECALAADLAGVLAGAEALRLEGCAIALENVGVEPES